MNARERIIAIFMKRDGHSYAEAAEYLDEAIQACREAIDAGEDADEVWMDETFLEPDYMYAVLFGA